MGYIGNEPTTGHFPVDNFTSSGGSTYTLTRVPASAGAIEVSVQGVLQPTTAYTVSGSTLTMAGVTSGVKIFVRHLGETLSLPTPADGSVTTAKLGTNSVDGTKIAMGSDAAGDILYHGATDYARLAKGTAAQVLTMNAGATAPEWAAAGGGGKVVQVVNTTNTTMSSGTTTIPNDATIPQKTEGTEFMTLAITPTSATNKLIIQSIAHGSVNANTINHIMALFQDTTANALCTVATLNPTSTASTTLNLQHYMTAGTTSATTFKIRIGPHTTGTYVLHGYVSGGNNLYFGGVSEASITIWEIAV